MQTRDRPPNDLGTSIHKPDPIHNYMSYSDDDCLNTLTAGKTGRMHELYKLRLEFKGATIGGSGREGDTDRN